MTDTSKTPRTEREWNAANMHGNPAQWMRNACAKLETELSAAQADRIAEIQRHGNDLAAICRAAFGHDGQHCEVDVIVNTLRAMREELSAAQADLKQWEESAVGQHGRTCLHHTVTERAETGCPVCEKQSHASTLAAHAQMVIDCQRLMEAVRVAVGERDEARACVEARNDERNKMANRIAALSGDLHRLTEAFRESERERIAAVRRYEAAEAEKDCAKDDVARACEIIEALRKEARARAEAGMDTRRQHLNAVDAGLDLSQDLKDFTKAAMTGLLANPNVVAHNPNHGWGIVNCTDESLIGYAEHLASIALVVLKEGGQ